MTSFATWVALCVERCQILAGDAQYVEMGRRFRRRGEIIEWTELLLPLALIAGVVAIGWLVARHLKRRAARNADSPQSLFTELCRAHGLSWANRRMLRALTRAYGLESAAQLFVEPQHFDIERLGPEWQGRKPRLAMLRSKLFGTSSGEVAEDA